MKKVLSLLITLAVSFSLIASPTFALDKQNTTGQAINQNKKLQNELTAAKNKLSKLQDQQTKLEQLIQKEIQNVKANAAKKQANNDKQTANANTLEEKWQAELDKAAAHDKAELDNLNADIAKWTEMTQKQTAVLTKELSDIDANLAKQLTALDTKLAAAKDDATKANITAAKANLQKYAQQRKDAINKYLTTLQGIWADRQKVWNERRDILSRRQASDMEFRTAMINIRKAELGDKLASLATVPTKSDSDIEKAVRAKFQKQADDLTAKINSVKAQIADLQTKLGN